MILFSCFEYGFGTLDRLNNPITSTYLNLTRLYSGILSPIQTDLQ